MLHCKIEELQLGKEGRVDVLVSEPMGSLLVHERMLETYLYARDHFLKPGGKMFPVSARQAPGPGPGAPGSDHAFQMHGPLFQTGCRL